MRPAEPRADRAAGGAFQVIAEEVGRGLDIPGVLRLVLGNGPAIGFDPKRLLLGEA